MEVITERVRRQERDAKERICNNNTPAGATEVLNGRKVKSDKEPFGKTRCMAFSARIEAKSAVNRSAVSAKKPLRARLRYYRGKRMATVPMTNELATSEGKELIVRGNVYSGNYLSDALHVQFLVVLVPTDVGYVNEV
jgi:hypothetical protein